MYICMYVYYIYIYIISGIPGGQTGHYNILSYIVFIIWTMIMICIANICICNRDTWFSNWITGAAAAAGWRSILYYVMLFYV
jgi:hypothetical protein